MTRAVRRTTIARTLAAAMVAASAAGVLSAAPADAASPPASGTYLTKAVGVRYCVNTAKAGCGTTFDATYNATEKVGSPTIALYQTVSMQCWIDGSSYTGPTQTSSRWFWVKSSTGTVGFVPAAVTRRQTTVGHCKYNHPVTAARIAAERYGEKYARDSDAKIFSTTSWTGPDGRYKVGEWSGDCPKLPYVGWFLATGNSRAILRNDAKVNYQTYKSAGKIKTGKPPVGAVVFYDQSAWGHTAIALGNGLIVTTSGSDGAEQKNVIRAYTRSANYLGYYAPTA